ncbi:hypothetical protein [Pedobacter ureilyticus]|uniref:Uncharacterized protein n=1 Tax=Pedobacter ureilyticus TaxID=1393051 RepID=A0ABW9J5A3_9SPHI|nr:hypothetical protein [Pedobacter helvus]
MKGILSKFAVFKLTNVGRFAYTFVLILSFSSCGDHIQREKDKYPNIPEFPKFGENKLMLKELEVATVEYKNHQSAEVDGHDLVIHTEDYFYYLETNQSLFVLTGYREAVEPGNEFPAKNFVQLIRVNAGKVEKLNWSEVAKAELRPLNNDQYISIGSKTFDIQSPRLTFSDAKPFENDSTDFSSWNFASRSGGDYYKIFDNTFVKEFDRVTIGSASRLSGGLNNGLNYTYDPIPLVYYEFNLDGKTGKTKINFDEQEPPLLIKIANKVYCVTYSSELKFKYEVKHYHIGLLE